jgi:8-oxo-dGTP diphosphatase
MERMTNTIDFEVKYTLAFCIVNGQVLMILRKNPPNANLWNGLGGKIEGGETPAENIKRELFEEAGLEVSVDEKHYKGIVKWNILDENKVGGTHLFLFQLDDLNPESINLESNEGELGWKPSEWVSDTSNTALVENIPVFFPQALLATQPKIYEFFYQGNNQLLKHLVNDLPTLPTNGE